tara:strand:+ start:3340 stop:3942 length:603 start_codon:yes stop_codon:yes gene_type:complete
MVSVGTRPSESRVFLIVVGAMLLFAVVWGTTNSGEGRADYRLRECVVNLEQIAARQEQIRAETGRYLSCPSFPPEVHGEEPPVWKLPCDPSSVELIDGRQRFSDCSAGQRCSEELGCIDPEGGEERTALLVPDCWVQLLGLPRDTVVRGQYRAEAPVVVAGLGTARFDLTCRTDLRGDGEVAEFRATESRTTYRSGNPGP